MSRVLPRGAALMVFVAFGFAVCPFEKTIIGEWRLRVLDSKGRPLKGCMVTEVWANYSVQREPYRGLRCSDTGGLVYFPRRTIRASLLTEWMGTVSQIARYGAHASFGPHADVTIEGCGGHDIHYVPASEAEHQPTEVTLIFRRPAGAALVEVPCAVAEPGAK